jgi:hypothetical protein
MKQCDRRRFLMAVGAGVASVPLSSLVTSRTALAQELPLVDPAGPVAVALEYVEESPDEAKLCSNCILYTDPEAEEQGPCAVFPGKSVKAGGWCKSWVLRP